MARPEKYQIVQHIALKELDEEADLFAAGENLTVAKARTFERNLMFIRMRYRGFSVAESSAASGISEPTAYEIQRRWNESGFAGLVPDYTGGPKPRLTNEQRAEIRRALESYPLDTRSIRLLIKNDYGVEYTDKQVHIILKKMGLHHAKPYPKDYRSPNDTEDRLKKNLRNALDGLKDRPYILGFQDESSPQTVANTVRLWSPDKPKCYKNTDKLKASAFGFYPINGGNPVISFPPSSKTADMCSFLGDVRRECGTDLPIVMVLDNCPFHHARAVSELAVMLDIRLVFLPPYSPQFNPKEFIWKTLKRTVSSTHFTNLDHMIDVLSKKFKTEASKQSYHKNWPFKSLCGIT